MPYLTCPSCGLRSYRVRLEPCPVCDSPQDAVPESIVRALALARDELRMDAAMVSEIAQGRETVRWVHGGEAFGIVAGASELLEDTICQRLLEGRIEALVTDVRSEPSLRDVPFVRSGALGAYLGVPVRTADARRYVLCCLAGERRPDLGPEDLRFLTGVGESVRVALESR